MTVREMTGANVKTWRETRGMSQADLARLLPMPVRTLQAWERGRGAPPPFMLRALEHLAHELWRASEAERRGGMAVLDTADLDTADGQTILRSQSETLISQGLPVIHPRMRGANVDLNAIDRTAPPVFDDVEDDSVPHYVRNLRRPSPYRDDRHPLADLPLPHEADTGGDDEPTHELAYVSGDEPA